MQRRALIWTFATALALRLGYLLLVRPPFETEYWALSTSLMHHATLAIDGVAMTDFEPMYPWSLAIARVLTRDHVLAVQVLQIVVTAAAIVPLYRLAFALAHDERVAAATAMLYAVHPLLVRQAAQASDLALATALLIVFARWFINAEAVRDFLLAAILLALVILTRSMTMPIAVLLAAVLLGRGQVRQALAFTAAVVVLVSPMMVRNAAVNGSWLPTRGGYNLYVANSAFTAALLPDDDPDALRPHVARLLEAEIGAADDGSTARQRVSDTILREHALRFIAAHPLQTLRQKTLNVLYFFSPRLVPLRTARATTGTTVPRPPIESVAYAVYFVPVLAAAVVGACRRRRKWLREDVVLWCIAATFVGVHVIYIPATRYRGPMEFVLLFYAAAALRHTRCSAVTVR